jgi:hypothetical protein
MKLRSILAGTAIAALSLVAAPNLGVTGITAQAEAAVNVSIGIFYDQLGSYGDWVSYRDQYVFIPGRVDAGWRPYTRGHWIYTNRYGWTWASDEPFGWATYHYGRWGYGEDIGWYWVPGRKWAPAWVSWRRSNDYVVWAPLPPSRGGVDVSININVGDIPDYYWVSVPTRRFLAPDLRVVIINDDRENRQVVRNSRFIGTPRVTNNIVVNNVIDVNVISQATGEKVKTVDVQTTNNPVEAKASADQVTVFQGDLATDAKMKPQKLTDVTKVKKVKRNAAASNGAGDTAAPPANANGNASAPVDNTATAPAENAPAAGGEQPATQAQDQPTGKKKKLKPQNDNAAAPAQTGEQPVQAQDQPTGKKKKQKPQNDNAAAPAQTGEQPVQAQDQPTGKKKKLKPQNDNAAAPAQSGEQPVQAQGQSTGKKKKKQQAGEEATGSTTAAPAQSDNGNAGNAPDQNANPPADQQKKGKGKKDQACDPTTDANCAPAQ